MSSEQKFPETIAEFYANALGLEYECEHRLIDLGRTLQAHHNPDAASIFERAEKMRAENIARLGLRCEALELPRIAPWDYHWHQFVDIEKICFDAVHYLISAHEAIELVLEKLAAARDYYRQFQSDAGSPEIRQAAGEILELLGKEVEIVKGWSAEYEQVQALPDYDPPHQPD